MSQNLSYKTITATKETKQIIIWLHGLGASADDFIPLARMMDLPHTTFIFPQAPSIPVTINANMIMPAWFDIYNIGPKSREDEPGIINNSEKLINLIAEVQKNHPKIPIKLIGFSQGGALALYTSITNQSLNLPVLGLSSYLPLAPKLIANKNSTHKSKAKTPQITLMHGNQDEIIPLEYAVLSQQTIINMGFSCPLEKYSMGHEVIHSQIADIMNWIKN